MPASQNRSNYAFRYGLLRLATTPTAKSGFKERTKYQTVQVIYEKGHAVSKELNTINNQWFNMREVWRQNLEVLIQQVFL